MQVLWFALVTSALAFCSQGLSIMSEPVPTCTYDGEPVPVGETRGSTCQPCTCHEGGYLACKIIDCAPVMCVTPKTRKHQCCHICPNGRNCEHPNENKKFLKYGNIFRNSTTECRCDPESFRPRTECRKRWLRTSPVAS